MIDKRGYVKMCLSTIHCFVYGRYRLLGLVRDIVLGFLLNALS